MKEIGKTSDHENCVTPFSVLGSVCSEGIMIGLLLTGLTSQKGASLHNFILIQVADS
jgi:hypothetical protein